MTLILNLYLHFFNFLQLITESVSAYRFPSPAPRLVETNMEQIHLDFRLSAIRLYILIYILILNYTIESRDCPTSSTIEHLQILRHNNTFLTMCSHLNYYLPFFNCCRVVHTATGLRCLRMNEKESMTRVTGLEC